MKFVALLMLSALPIPSFAENAGRFWMEENATLVLTRALPISREGYVEAFFLGDRHCVFEAYAATPVTLPAGAKLKGQIYAWDRYVSQNSFSLERQALTGIQFFPADAAVEILARCESARQWTDPAREVPSFASFRKRAAPVFTLAR